MMKYTNNPYLKILQELSTVEANTIRSEYPQVAYSRLLGSDKQHCQAAVKALSEDKPTKIPRLGKTGAIQLLAAITQYLDSIDWPLKEDEVGIKDDSVEHPEPTVGMLKKAKSLKIKPLTPGSWYVTGGTAPHVVSVLGSWECDCLAFSYRGICSHIAAVENFAQRKQNE